MGRKISSILIVEDSMPDHFLAEHAIMNFNTSIEIIKTYDGQEALEALDKLAHPPSLILLDLNMPRMNGFEFLEAYNKRADKQKNVAILTSSISNDDKTKAMDYDCVLGYLNKPIDEHMLGTL